MSNNGKRKSCQLHQIFCIKVSWRVRSFTSNHHLTWTDMDITRMTPSFVSHSIWDTDKREKQQQCASPFEVQRMFSCLTFVNMQMWQEKTWSHHYVHELFLFRWKAKSKKWASGWKASHKGCVFQLWFPAASSCHHDATAHLKLMSSVSISLKR